MERPLPVHLEGGLRWLVGKWVPGQSIGYLLHVVLADMH